jgi:hypothetical protein
MSTSDSSVGFKWKLDSKTEFRTWKKQFKAFADLKVIGEWLVRTPNAALANEVGGDANCKAQLVLAMKDSRLIDLCADAKTAFATWTALTTDFEGRMRIRKHELVQLLRDFRQPKSESFVEYCDRADRS